MASVKLTKNEQKKQKDQLKQFKRYLPTLQLKKQQLQMVIRQIEQEVERYRKVQREIVNALQAWVAVYHENLAFSETERLEQLVLVDKVVKVRGNIAGVAIPVFKELTFKPILYDIDRYHII